jgi:acetyl esterase/lipase
MRAAAFLLVVEVVVVAAALIRAVRPPPSPPVPNHCDSLPTQPCLMLWPGAVPNETSVPKTPPETRNPDDGHGCGPGRDAPCDHIYNISLPSLTPFLVKNGTGAAIIIAPGGGYHSLAWSKEGIDVAHMYNRIGVSAFVLKYRVPASGPAPSREFLPGMPRWWAPLQDAQRAVGLVRFHAAKFGINASRIGFTGSSAGGHLTAHISTAFAARVYKPVDSADAVSCRPDFSVFQCVYPQPPSRAFTELMGALLRRYPWRLLPNNKVPAWGAAYSLADEFSGISQGHPPSVFIQNSDDTTAPPQGTLAYAQKLLAINAPKSVIHM